jgi:hypothetical protein
MATESRWSGPIVSAPLEDVTDVSVELKYETPDWETIYEIRAINGRPVIAAIRIAPRTEGPVPPELPASLVRELLRPGEAVERARAYMTDPLIVASASVVPMLRATLDRYHDSRPRRGKRQPDHFYASIASRYLEVIASGSRKPVEVTAAQLGEEDDFVRYALDRARKRKLLARPDSPGKAGGCLTQLGRKALEAVPPEQPLQPGRA